jgi:hypothetical protein
VAVLISYQHAPMSINLPLLNRRLHPPHSTAPLTFMCR